MTKIVVTGGSGKAGRAVVRDLLDHGYDVLNVDSAPPAERISPFLRADLTHYGEAVEVLHRCGRGRASRGNSCAGAVHRRSDVSRR